MTFVKFNNGAVILLALVVSLASFLMLFKSSDSDFMQPDEYLYFNGAEIGNTLRYFIFNLPDIVARHAISDYVSKMIKPLQDYGRPGYHFLSAVATFFLGESKATAFRLSAILNILTVIMTYLFTLWLFRSKPLALLAALFLALNSGHVLYGRMAHQTPGAVLFLVTAFYCYVRSREEKNRQSLFLSLAAISYGLAFSVHPCAAYLGPVFILLEVHRSLFDDGLRPKEKVAGLFKNGLVFSVFFLLTISIWELPHFLTYIYFLAKGRVDTSVGYFRSLTLINNIQSYFAELFFRSFSDQSNLKADFRSLLYFPSFLKDSQGLLYCLVLLAAVIYIGFMAVRRIRDYRYLTLLCWIGAVYLLYGGINIYKGRPAGFRELRMFTLIIPPICAVMACFFRQLLMISKKKFILRGAVLFTLAVLLVSNVSRISSIITSQASYKKMNDYLKSHPEIDKVITSVNVYTFAPHRKVLDRLQGFVIANARVLYKDVNRYQTEIGTSRIAVLYREKGYFEKNSIFCATSYGATWDDIRRLYHEGRVRYLVSCLWDRCWIRELPKAEPIFSYPSPFVCRARIYDLGIAPNLDEFFNNPYNRRIGLYDLKDIFEPAASSGSK